MLIAGTPCTYLPEPLLPHHAVDTVLVPVKADTLDGAVVASHRNDALTASAPVRTMASSGIERSGARNLDEILKTFAGISVRDYGGIGGLKTVSVRSLGSQHTAVCYDGIPVSDACNGYVDICRFNLDNVSLVKVSIGGTDDIFCSARHLTSAGVLEIHSVKPDFRQGPVQAEAGMGIASFGTYMPYVIYRQRLCRGWALSASATCTRSKGDYPFVLRNGSSVTNEKRLNSDVSSANAEISVSGDMGSGGELSAKILFAGSGRGLPGSVVLYTQNPSERLRERSLIANAVYTNSIGGRFRVRAGLGYSRSYNRYRNTDKAYPVPQDDRYAQDEYSLSAIVMYAPLRHGLLNGLRIVLAEDFFVNSLSATIPECQFPARYTSMSALSARYSAERLAVTAGLAGTLVHETVRYGTPAPCRKRFSPYASFSYKVLRKEELRLRVSLRDGFRMPTFNDLYYARVGNASLVPEKAFQTNLGLTWSHNIRGGSVSITVDGYYNAVRDKIVAIPTMFIWKMHNAGKVRMAGADLAAAVRYPFADGFVIDAAASYSFQYAADVTDPQAKNFGHRIPYTPEHSGSITAGIETPWANVSYIMTAVGQRYCLAQNIPVNRIEPYTDHCISVNRTFMFGRSHRYGLYAGIGVFNIGNRNYEIIRYYPMPGRNWRVTLKVTY